MDPRFLNRCTAHDRQDDPDEVVDEFMEVASQAYWIIKDGETAGSSPRHKLQQAMSESAKADEPLQRFLASIGGAASD